MLLCHPCINEMKEICKFPRFQMLVCYCANSGCESQVIRGWSMLKFATTNAPWIVFCLCDYMFGYPMLVLKNLQTFFCKTYLLFQFTLIKPLFYFNLFASLFCCYSWLLNFIFFVGFSPNNYLLNFSFITFCFYFDIYIGLCSLASSTRISKKLWSYSSIDVSKVDILLHSCEEWMIESNVTYQIFGCLV
jgi:hypothetical protein